VHRLQIPRGAPPLTAPEAAAGENGEAVRGSVLGPFLVAGAVVVADQLTKLWAVAALPGRPVHVVDRLLELRLTRNPGGAFSILTGLTPVLAVLAAVMAVVLVRTTRRTTDRIVAYSLALVLGGAVGNLVDRLVRSPGVLRGEVVDFIKLPHWPTFNLADSAITIGVALIIVRGWKS
jgi:signal peptidase II